MKKIIILQIIGCMIFAGFIFLFNGAGYFTPTKVILLYAVMGLCNIINATWMVVKPVEDKGMRDELTGLLNRIGLTFNQKKYIKKSYTIIFLDLNYLKKINDIHGHDQGDVILKRAAERLKYWEIYGNVYRVGGDEFLVVIPDTFSKEKLDYLINGFDNSKLNYKFNDDFECKFSFGIAEKQKGIKKTFMEVMSEADDKMYVMKKNK